MDYIICPECGTENEKDYRFCKNCGTALLPKKEEKPLEEKIIPNSEPVYSNAQQPPQVQYIDGVPLEDIILFVGKKAHKIVPKFQKMFLSSSKISWCWPTAILAYLFGPIGAAFWFFYRKMYKAALITTAIGIAFLFAQILPFSDTYTQIFNSITSSDIGGMLSAVENISVQQSLISELFSLIEIVFAILFGLFSYNSYKKHCISKITLFKQRLIDQRFYKIGLSSIGGTSGGMLTLGIIIYIVSTQLSTFLAILISQS